MKFILNYKAFNWEERKSLFKKITSETIPYKKEILQYLEESEEDGVICSSVYDYISKKRVPRTIHSYTDGTFTWDDEEIYHFKHYNTELSAEFINHVLKIIKKKNTTSQ